MIWVRAYSSTKTTVISIQRSSSQASGTSWEFLKSRWIWQCSLVCQNCHPPLLTPRIKTYAVKSSSSSRMISVQVFHSILATEWNPEGQETDVCSIHVRQEDCQSRITITQARPWAGGVYFSRWVNCSRWRFLCERGKEVGLLAKWQEPQGFITSLNFQVFHQKDRISYLTWKYNFHQTPSVHSRPAGCDKLSGSSVYRYSQIWLKVDFTR